MYEAYGSSASICTSTSSIISRNVVYTTAQAISQPGSPTDPFRPDHRRGVVRLIYDYTHALLITTVLVH